MNSKPSFTLIELLVVIAIVGILAGIIIVSMSGATTSATIAKAKVFANSMRDSMGNNIVSEWKFDGSGVADGATATADYVKDTWGSNNGTIYGSPLVKSGSDCVYGSCLSFDGVDDYIDFGNASSLNFGTNDFSVEFWVNCSNGTINNIRSIVGKTTSNANASGYFIGTTTYGGSGSNGRLLSSVTNGAWTTGSIENGIFFSTNSWHHVVYIRTGTTSKHYLDGKLDAKITKSGMAENVDSTTPQMIGKMGTSYFAGMVDEVRIYNATIPLSLIENHYLAGLKSLLANKQITEDDYSQRLVKVNNFCLTDKKYE